MNKQQRKRLEKIQNDIDILAEEEQDKYDNAPENLQDSDTVCKFEENADTLREISENITEILEGGA